VKPEAYQLWRDTLLEGIRASYGAHRPCNANGAIYVADEVLKRYLDRFDPEADDDVLVRVMDEDRARVLAEEAEYVDAAKAAAELERLKHGPWRAGETLYVASRGGKAVEVIEEMGKPKVAVRLDGRRVDIHRDDLTGVKPEADSEQPAPGLQVVQ
jgi:hypothetical protein